MRIVSICLTILCCSALIGCVGCSRFGAQDKASATLEKMDNFQWPEGKRVAISLTFDDARLSQVDRGIPVLDEYDVKATFYVSLGSLEKRLDGWKAAVANGHEIGNHSLVHPCSGNFPFSRNKALEDYTYDQMRSELQQASDKIEDLVGVRPVSFAYPCGQKYVGRGRNYKSYVPLIAEEFLSGRGWMNEWANDPGFCDLANLMGVELDGKSFEQVKQVMDRVLKEGGWLVFAGHEIGDEERRQMTLTSTLRALCEYAQDPANGIWLDTVENISRYIIEQRSPTRVVKAD